MLFASGLYFTQGPHLRIVTTGGATLRTVTLPEKVLFFAHSDTSYDITAVLNTLLNPEISVSRSGAKLTFASAAHHRVRVYDGADAEKVARFLGLYTQPADWTAYINASFIGEAQPSLFCTVLPDTVGYLHDSADLNGRVEYIALSAVADGGTGSSVGVGIRHPLQLEFRFVPRAFLSGTDVGATSEAGGTLWQVLDPRFTVPRVFFEDGSEQHEYALAELPGPGAATPVRDGMADFWHFALKLYHISA